MDDLPIIRGKVPSLSSPLPQLMLHDRRCGVDLGRHDPDLRLWHRPAQHPAQILGLAPFQGELVTAAAAGARFPNHYKQCALHCSADQWPDLSIPVLAAAPWHSDHEAVRFWPRLTSTSPFGPEGPSVRRITVRAPL
jgi:hypothetical protein